MTPWMKRWGAAQLWRASGRTARNRSALYDRATGLRIIVFHSTPPHNMRRFQHIVQWCRDRFAIASPSDADALFTGNYAPGDRDRILITFDDGFESNFEAARWLASIDVRAVFFLLPSLIGRTIGEYFEYHRRRGVEPYACCRPTQRGLNAGQVREMIAMGHRIAAHNFAHRDLALLHSPVELNYEIGNALDEISRLTGEPCHDFALAFGQPHNVSPEAIAYLLKHCPRVYACERGLNVPGRTPRFLLRYECEMSHPLSYTLLAIRGGADHRAAARVEELAARVGRLPLCQAPLEV